MKKEEFFTPDLCTQCENNCKSEINISLRSAIEKFKNSFTCARFVKNKHQTKKGEK